MFRTTALSAIGLLIACTLVSGPAFAQTEEVTGTVVSVSDNMIVIRTATGTETLMIDSQSNVPTNLSADQKVTVAYRTDSANDQWIVSRVNVDRSSSMAQSQEAQTSSERSRLPQTASPLPWIVLLGLTALGGFVALGRKRVTH